MTSSTIDGLKASWKKLRDGANPTFSENEDTIDWVFGDVEDSYHCSRYVECRVTVLIPERTITIELTGSEKWS